MRTALKWKAYGNVVELLTDIVLFEELINNIHFAPKRSWRNLMETGESMPHTSIKLIIASAAIVLALTGCKGPKEVHTQAIGNFLAEVSSDIILIDDATEMFGLYRTHIDPQVKDDETRRSWLSGGNSSYLSSTDLSDLRMKFHKDGTLTLQALNAKGKYIEENLKYRKSGNIVRFGPLGISFLNIIITFDTCLVTDSALICGFSPVVGGRDTTARFTDDGHVVFNVLGRKEEHTCEKTFLYGEPVYRLTDAGSNMYSFVGRDGQPYLATSQPIKYELKNN